MLVKHWVTEMVTSVLPGQLLVSHSVPWAGYYSASIVTGLGGKPLLYNQLTEADLDELAKTKPTLTYGSGPKPAPVEFIPAHVAFDKKVKQVMYIHV